MAIVRLLALVAVLAGAAWAGAGRVHAQPMGDMVFRLAPQNNSGLMGIVRLSPLGHQTRVTIELRGGQAATGSMPAHIHAGTCANLNPQPAFPLTAVTNGRSETTVNASVDQLMTAAHAVNVHKSPQEVSVYFACGDLDHVNLAPMGPGQPGQPGQPGRQATLFALAPQNNSGERGAVVLIPMGNQTRVSIRLRGQPAGSQQPAHIHAGTCENLNPQPAYPLTAVVNGRSDTVVNASVDQLRASAHAVNVHRSAQEVSVYVACGDLNQANMLRPRMGPGGPGQPRPMVQMPRPPTMGGQMPMGGPMPMRMPRAGEADLPLVPLAAAALAAMAIGLLLRRTG